MRREEEEEEVEVGWEEEEACRWVWSRTVPDELVFEMVGRGRAETALTRAEAVEVVVLMVAERGR